MEIVARALLVAALALRLLPIGRKRWPLALRFSPEPVFQNLRRLLKYSGRFSPVLLRRSPSQQGRRTVTEGSRSSSGSRPSPLKLLRPSSTVSLFSQSSVCSLRLETERVNRMTVYCSSLERKANWVDSKQARETLRREEEEKALQDLRHTAKLEADFNRWREAESKRLRKEERKRKEADWMAAKEAAHQASKAKRLEGRDDLARSAARLALSEHTKAASSKAQRHYQTDRAHSRKEFFIASKAAAPAPPPCENPRDDMAFRLKEALRRNQEIVGRIMDREKPC